MRGKYDCLLCEKGWQIPYDYEDEGYCGRICHDCAGQLVAALAEILGEPDSLSYNSEGAIVDYPLIARLLRSCERDMVWRSHHLADRKLIGLPIVQKVLDQ